MASHALAHMTRCARLVRVVADAEEELTMLRRSFGFGLAAASLASASGAAFAQNDPLPSWNDGVAKQAILDFVARTTTTGGREFVPVPERIATFDNDGTLWCEQPVYFQFAFAMDRV